ncbi:MAG: hypothetical protein ACRC6M_18085 [Microcystaceae cyanobacterium]
MNATIVSSVFFGFFLACVLLALLLFREIKSQRKPSASPNKSKMKKTTIKVSSNKPSISKNYITDEILRKALSYLE